MMDTLSSPVLGIRASYSEAAAAVLKPRPRRLCSSTVATTKTFRTAAIVSSGSNLPDDEYDGKASFISNANASISRSGSKSGRRASSATTASAAVVTTDTAASPKVQPSSHRETVQGEKLEHGSFGLDLDSGSREIPPPSRPAAGASSVSRGTSAPTVLPRTAKPLPISTATAFPGPSLAATVCNALDAFINTFIDGPPRPSVDPSRVLCGNFSPVAELPPTPCPVVKGSIPPCLAGGAYIRNGPNPQYLPQGPHHLFDGDGMLHSLLLPPGDGASPILCSRFVRTYKYGVEREAGEPVMPNAFASFHGLPGLARGAVVAARVATGQMNPLQGIGLANTSLAVVGDRLLAMGESDLPYAVQVDGRTGDITTLGRHDFGGELAIAMTAHPKKDPATGEVFAFRYGPVPPFLSYFRFDREGNKCGPEVPIYGVQQPSFLHDFAITRRYALFPDMQIVMKPLDLVLGGSPVGTDPSKVPRLGILPRYATSERDMRWVELPGFNPVHTINAWEEDPDGNVVVLVAPNVMSVEHALERTELVHACVEMVRIDLRDGTVTRTPLSAGNFDFGVINPAYVGRKNRYGYVGIGDPMPKISGVAKLDFEKAAAAAAGGTSSATTDCVVASRLFGPGCFGGEPFFVAKDANDEEADEDDGYLVSYVHDEINGESRFVVMDAKSPELETVAEVLLPRRVPYGFHGLFVSQREIHDTLKHGGRSTR